MIYPNSFEHKTGFDAVREMVEKECTSPLGRSCAETELTFSSDAAHVENRLRATAEMAGILAAEGGAGFPLGPVHDLRDELSRLRLPGTWMPEAELMQLRSTLGVIGDIAGFFADAREDDGTTPYPTLDGIASELRTFPDIIREIDRILDRFGEVKDSASAELAQIRRSISSTSASVASAMRRVISQAVSEGYLEPDTTPSVRDGRLVIPVAPKHKRKIPGITHDESASGKTFYIEPAAVVEANNRLRELRIEERHEVTRILTALADLIRPHAEEIKDEGLGRLAIFDFIHAKARFANKTGGTLPHISARPELEWYHACHPVLELSLSRQGKEIVPLDITLSAPDRRILVISGPNAGGKSVTLKTVAIVQYMMQCGLLPTLHDNSHMGVMESIFIDIGDDQSIEDDLSTYSSHLRNMKFFLNRGNERTLALIDEFGGGTEPQIGGAIAQALLKAFNERKMWGVITTHFHNLKQYAEETPGLVNGSMLYDRHHMLPTFRLAVGQPGSSFALEIARKTGLPEELLQEARELVGSDYVNLDKYLLDIARDRRYWENKRQDIHRKEKHLDELIGRYADEAETLRMKRREIIGEARDEARKILEGSNAAIENTIREIREAQAEKARTAELRKRLDKEKRQLAEGEGEDGSHPLIEKARRKTGKKGARDIKTQAAPKAPDEPLKPGDNVVMEGSTAVGTISDISGKTATVVFGQLKTTVKLDRLRRTIRKAPSPARRPGEGANTSYLSSATAEMSRKRQLNFKQEIDVRGMRVDEAVQAVMYYIDDAVQFNAGRVRILHGTGTGALRQYIRNYLQSVGAVRSFHDEDVRLGGAGITIVEFE
ncbi:MAG: Smr/MutS family protein [Muribaculaceae bacterium]|nr:Smr/MutS family protein [Muribaculaceae bacterium]